MFGIIAICLIFFSFQMFSAKEIELQVIAIEKEKEEAEKKKPKKTLWTLRAFNVLLCLELFSEF